MKIFNNQIIVGLLQFVFINEQIRNRISKVETDKVNLGFLQLANKGATSLKMNVDDTSMVFTNMHLEAGQKQIEARAQNLIELHEKMFQSEGTGKLKQPKILDNHYSFLFGDMNFRIQLSTDHVRFKLQQYFECLKNNQIDGCEMLLQDLKNNDQLQLIKNVHPYLKFYKEEQINFLPTYKYDMGSQEYDSSKKQRVPSWCDRIMVSNKPDHDIIQTFYNRIETLESDHRAVVAFYQLETQTQNKETKQNILSQIAQENYLPKQNQIKEYRKTKSNQDVDIQKNIYDNLQNLTNFDTDHQKISLQSFDEYVIQEKQQRQIDLLDFDDEKQFGSSEEQNNEKIQTLLKDFDLI